MATTLCCVLSLPCRLVCLWLWLVWRERGGRHISVVSGLQRVGLLHLGFSCCNFECHARHFALDLLPRLCQPCCFVSRLSILCIQQPRVFS